MPTPQPFFINKKKLKTKQQFTVTHHIETAKHKRAKNRNINTIKTSGSQQQVATFSKKSSFCKYMCKAILSHNVLLHKINHPEYRPSLKTYMKRNVPNESTSRKNYVDDIYFGIIKEI